MKFTSEQIDKMIAFAEQNFPEDAAPLPLDIDGLQKNFNAEMRIFLDKCQFDDAEVAEVMETLLLIKDFYQITEFEGGKFFFNTFGDRTAIFGLSTSDYNLFRLLTCAYTMPETKDEDTLSSVILATFVKILLPTVEFFDTEKFLRELSTSVTKTQDGIKFSIAADGNLIFVKAVKEAIA